VRACSADQRAPLTVTGAGSSLSQRNSQACMHGHHVPIKQAASPIKDTYTAGDDQIRELAVLIIMAQEGSVERSSIVPPGASTG